MAKLDYLILHGDADHMGESIDIIKQFKVNKVILNSGSLTELEERLIRTLNQLKTPYSFAKVGMRLK